MSKAVVETAPQNAFFEALSAASKRTLLLDYDGTVAPFNPNRCRAYPYPAVPALLHQITANCRTRLIVISGRTVHEIARLLGICPLPELWGSCGMERLYPNGRYEVAEVTEAALSTLGEAECLLERAGFGDRIEVKLAGVAIHWRGLQPGEILKIRSKAYPILEQLARRPEMVFSEFDEGVELRLRSACKGEAVRKLLSEVDDYNRIAYLGDDRTDEDAFRILNGKGLTVMVRSKRRFTAAQVWLRPPEELVQFLKSWIRASAGGA